MELTIASVQTSIQNGIFSHKPNEKKTRGQFWDVFDQIFEKIDGNEILVKKFVYCRMCKRVFNYDSKKGNSNLNAHSSSCKEPIKTIESFLPRTNVISFDDKKKICLKTTAAAVQDNRPFNFAQCTGVLELLHFVWMMGARVGAVTKDEFRKAVPCGTTVSRNVNKLSTKCKEVLRDTLIAQLERGTTIAFTTDIWQDKHKRMSYLCLTAHYFDRTTKSLVDFILAMHPMEPGRKKDNVYIRQIIWSKLVEFGISEYASKFVFISDRGGNIRVALRDFVRLNCFPHFLHSTVKYACEVDSVKSLIDSCAAVVRYFKFNGLNNMLDLTLKSAINTRFNYVVIMMDSIYKQYDEIERILRERNESIRLRNMDRDVIRAVMEFLSTFLEASLLAESNYKPTIGNVWLGISEILTVCRVVERDSTCIRAMKARALHYIEKKFVLNKHHRIATFLNPNYKSLAFTTPSLKIKTIEDTREMCSALPREPSSAAQILTSSESSSGSESSFLSNYHDRTEREHEWDEIDSYISMRWVPDGQVDLFSWWLSRKDVFPQLSKVAIGIHSIPASSMQSERHFSRCGITITDRRNRICPTTLEDVMILNKQHNFDVCIE